MGDKGSQTTLQQKIRAFVKTYLERYDADCNHEIGGVIGYVSNVAAEAGLENIPAGVRLYTDGALYDLFESEGIDSEFGYFENKFPEQFEAAASAAGLYFEPYSPGVYDITED